MKGADQRRNVRAEEIKEADQRRKMRSDKTRIRAVTKKPAIRGPIKIKNRHGSEDAVSLVRVTL
jgi:hypothetical protein